MVNLEAALESAARVLESVKGTTANFNELSGRIRGLLISIWSALSSRESAEIEEFLDHAELGEALRALAWLIVEEGKEIAVVDIHEIQALAARMAISDELPGSLIQHGVSEG